MHSDHPDTHTHGLDDSCERCAEHAQHPTGLDYDNVRRIWRGDTKTLNDMKAYNNMYATACTVQHMMNAFRWEGYTLLNQPTTLEFDSIFDYGGQR